MAQRLRHPSSVIPPHPPSPQMAALLAGTADLVAQWMNGKKPTTTTATRPAPGSGLRFAFCGRTSTVRHQDRVPSQGWQRDMADELVAGHGRVVATYFDAGTSRRIPWRQRPRAARGRPRPGAVGPRWTLGDGTEGSVPCGSVAGRPRVPGRQRDGGTPQGGRSVREVVRCGCPAGFAAGDVRRVVGAAPGHGPGGGGVQPPGRGAAARDANAPGLAGPRGRPGSGAPVVGAVVRGRRRAAVPGDGDAGVPPRPRRRHRHPRRRDRRCAATPHVDDRVVRAVQRPRPPDGDHAVGRTPAGLPVGMQVVAAHGADTTATVFARHASSVTGGYVFPR